MFLVASQTRVAQAEFINGSAAIISKSERVIYIYIYKTKKKKRMRYNLVQLDAVLSLDKRGFFSL